MKISDRLLDNQSFLQLPPSARLLLYDLLITANEYGYVNEVSKLKRRVHPIDADFDLLEKTGFIAFSKPLFGSSDSYCIQITRQWR